MDQVSRKMGKITIFFFAYYTSTDLAHDRSHASNITNSRITIAGA